MVEKGDLDRSVHIEHKAVDDNPTGGHLRYVPIVIPDIDPGETVEISISFAYNIDIAAGRVYGVVDENGDNAADPSDDILVYCDIGVVGTVAVAAAINDTEITVSDSVVVAVEQGHFVKIGTAEYEVVSVDVTNKKITLGTGLAAAAAVSDTVSLNVYFAGEPGNPMHFTKLRINYDWGTDTADSTRLPAGKPLKLSYTNNSTGPVKAVYGELAILY